MKRFLPILFICLLAASSCTKKELPEPVSDSPTVWMQCRMNGFPFKLNVGENATYASSWSYVSNNCRQFKFSIEATDIKKSFQIAINNFADTASSNVMDDLEKTIVPGNYTFTYSPFTYYFFRPREINITYTDKANKKSYYSIPAIQKSNARFTIVSVKDIIEDGKKYKLAEIRFSCSVVYDDGFNLWQYDVTDGSCSIPFGG